MTVEDQARLVFAAVEALLASQGASPGDLLRLVTYVVGRESLAGFNRIRDEVYACWFPDGTYPPNTLVLVAGLAIESLLVEVEGSFALPASASGACRPLAMVTPTREDGTVDLSAAALASHLVDHGHDGDVLNGTTGEGRRPKHRRRPTSSVPSSKRPETGRWSWAEPARTTLGMRSEWPSRPRMRAHMDCCRVAALLAASVLCPPRSGQDMGGGDEFPRTPQAAFRAVCAVHLLTAKTMPWTRRSKLRSMSAVRPKPPLASRATNPCRLDRNPRTASMASSPSSS